MSRLYRLARPALMRLDPERAHGLSVKALRTGLFGLRRPPYDKRMRVEIAGMALPNPLGLAAGYDKNAEVVDGALGLGFGFMEVGTVTPKPQAGNPPPRIFRLEGSGAIVNRLGFNNDGHADVLGRLAARDGRPGIVGVNIGANKTSEDRVADYIEGVDVFGPVADYLTVNISSPNTPGLRAFQRGKEFDRLITAVVAARDGHAAMTATRKRPIFVKIAPDLEEDEIDAMAKTISGTGVDGLIVSNTTLSREGVRHEMDASESGGLSGLPLLTRSNYVLARFRRAIGSTFPLIGVGGVHDARSLVAKIAAGAHAVQLYTALAYRGPDLPRTILRDLATILDEKGVASIEELRNTGVDDALAAWPGARH